MFSIITPTYNRRDLLPRTIESIKAQTFKEWELIIVDDGSTDDTEQVIQHYLTDPRIKYIKKQNTGQAHSLNVGVDYATKKFITFLDSDDEAYTNWLEVVSKHIKEDTGIVCVGAIRKLLDGTKVEDGIFPYKFYDKIVKVKFTCGSLFIRHTAFTAIGGYDIELKSNIQTDLGYRLMEYIERVNLKVVSLDEYLVQINIHTGPRIRTSWDKTRIGGIQFFNKHHQYFKKYDPVGLSYICGSIAFSSFKSKKRGEAVRFLLRAIKYNPSKLKNYARLLKYTLQ